MKKHSRGFAILQAVAWFGALCAVLLFYGFREGILVPTITWVLILGVIVGFASILVLRKAT
ncbi:MAG: hypothetical protein KYX67_14215 [Brevundimonas sp.]|jgi:hypothetical protein|uniref:hypothetical protein n=1 Tax=Brevundimonas sp. TaxID=1871086 RepID=UPI00255FDC2B|nr:hypothetical protein [Brevundimonas sp.]MDK2748467.1 hypothetical protein [Brevundimonas sp.]